ncbi:MAG: acyl carrier protein [Chitinophagales bacterium]|nr:acyl carrier protein [Chitinophagales bacterium]
MDIGEFIEIFRSSFDELEEELSPSTKFKELSSWTSMQALLLIAEIDDELNFVLSADDIKNSQTIEDLFLIVNS